MGNTASPILGIFIGIFLSPLSWIMELKMAGQAISMTPLFDIGSFTIVKGMSGLQNPIMVMLDRKISDTQGGCLLVFLCI